MISVYFDSVAAAIAMDGHGVFVWSAYLIACVAIALLLILPRRRERKLLRQLAGDLRRQQVLEESPTGGQ